MHVLNYSSNKKVKKKYPVRFFRLQNWIYKVFNTEKTENTDIKVTAAFQKNKKTKERERPFINKDHVTEKNPVFNKIKKIMKQKMQDKAEAARFKNLRTGN